MAQTSPYGLPYHMSQQQYYMAPHPQHVHYPSQLLLPQVMRQEQPIRKRPKYTRSKTGCLTCRQKKIKCDEGKPSCQRCALGQRECAWPEGVDPRKKPLERQASLTDERPSTSSSLVSDASDSPTLPPLAPEQWTHSMPSTASNSPEYDTYYVQKMHGGSTFDRSSIHDPFPQSGSIMQHGTSLRRMSAPNPQTMGYPAMPALGTVQEYAPEYPTQVLSHYSHQAAISSRHSSRPSTTNSLPPSRFPSDTDPFAATATRMASATNEYIQQHFTNRSYAPQHTVAEPQWAYEIPPPQRERHTAMENMYGMR